MGTDGGWEPEVWTDSFRRRTIHLQFQGKGAHSWALEKRDGLTRGMYNELHGDGRFVGTAIADEAQ